MSLHKFIKVHLTSIAFELFITDILYSKQDHAQKSCPETLWITQNKNSKPNHKMLSMIIRQSQTQKLQLKIFRQEHRAKKRLQK